MERIHNCMDRMFRLTGMGFAILAAGGLLVAFLCGGCYGIDWAICQIGGALYEAHGNPQPFREPLYSALKVAFGGVITSLAGIVGFMVMFILYDKVYYPLSEMYIFVGLRRWWYGMCPSKNYNCYTRQTHHCGLHRGHNDCHDSLDPADPTAWE